MDHHKPTIHIAAISIPAFSHQASILQFSKRLVHLHPHLQVTCIFPTIDSPPDPTIAILQTLPSSIHCIFLPPISKHDLVDPQHNSTPPPAVQIQLAVSRSLPSLCDALKSLRFGSSSPSPSSPPPLVALITDPFANEVLEIAKELDLLSFVYFPPSAMTLSLFLNLPRLDQETSCEYRDLKDPIEIFPGCSIPINGLDLPEHLQDRSSLSYELILQRCKRFPLADGFLVNTFFEMEHRTVTALQNVFPIGPIVQAGSSTSENGSGCVEWLENQTPRSVLYVSFGSGGTLSGEQLNELALGLELSGQKFLWVVRKPSESANSAYLSDEKQDSLQFLPSGFIERTKERGLVASSWAPQSEILRHSSTGGFLTHCGWNSILESIVCGVPMMTWPLFAEQKMNAVLLTEGLKVALRPKENERGIVEKEEIAEMVRRLMEGREEGNGIRRRIEELKDAASSALKKDGSSTKALSQVVDQIQVETFWRQKQKY
ncbi:hydroquinone glucosyltransferase-like [Neltuma alba]|uniref:hydroquinone glucosyltransferase-like n=1 Tax=Neltuma alba TaxID=207710 RepID=UPI0010A41AF1|nr:hydroquinone glucosyltransferase-like [Prosopis alba]XP_028802748.1 hydroquinone glucosyltransferase-like [Prosopis alba]